ncbi:hypothetical protein PULV_a3941 [Pseudoalteromonas ulvae UL12]|uniref:hypothetical protein n=1 Tax=Pseudoalteromonas ulvae TaxID=107327 RepID=UPI00186B6435|nr:hypothetical protein [Pseudoalteromonas ulvae]MBE0362137.1 hypothetical protein [Pseudoalteromonas ulvae UL12]
MWFVTNTTIPPKFYRPDTDLILVTTIEWITEQNDESGNIVWRGSPTIKNNQQAIHALYTVGVKGYRTKDDAKKFAKTMGIKTWKYLSLK